MNQTEKDFMKLPTPILIGHIQALGVKENRLPDYPLDPETYLRLKYIVENKKDKLDPSGLTNLVIAFCRGYAEGRRYQDEYLKNRE